MRRVKRGRCRLDLSRVMGRCAECETVARCLQAGDRREAEKDTCLFCDGDDGLWRSGTQVGGTPGVDRQPVPAQVRVGREAVGWLSGHPGSEGSSMLTCSLPLRQGLAE